MKRMKFAKVIVLLALAAAVISSCGCQHEAVIDQAVAETCTNDGLTEGSHCSKCGKVLIKQEAIPAGHKEVIQTQKEATCTESGLTEGKYCSICGKVFVKQTTISPLGHSTATGKCSRCGQDVGGWVLSYYYDEFNKPTNNAFITNAELCEGTFNNSATSNSDLAVRILADKDAICFMLYEYGRSIVKNSSSRYDEYYNITMRTSDGKKFELEGPIYAGADRIVLEDWVDNYNALLNALKSGKTVDFYIEQADRPVCNYLFSVNSSNFADLYKKIK